MPSRTILLVDADPLQRQLVDMLLAEDAPAIVNAGSGREALEYLKEHTPHLIILALELPDIGGDVVCGKLKSVSRLSRVPVVLTIEPPGRAGIPPGLRERARAVRADLLIQKPLGDKGLRDRVRNLLARWDRPADRSPRSTKSTVIIEEALEELGGELGGGLGNPADPIADALHRENEALRLEVASLQRRLARLEAGLPGHGGADAVIVAGGEPAAPDTAAGGADAAGADAAATGPAGPDREADPSEPDTAATSAQEPSAVRAGDGPVDPVEALRQRVRELERRNKALLEALSTAEAKSAAGERGRFGRRRP